MKQILWPLDKKSVGMIMLGFFVLTGFFSVNYLSAATHPNEYVTTTFEPTKFSKTEITGGEVFYAKIASKGVLTKAAPTPSKGTRVTLRYLADHKLSGEEYVLNPSFRLTIEPFPQKKGESYRVSNDIPLRFPTGSVAGDYTIIEEVMRVEVKDPKLGWQEPSAPTKPPPPTKPSKPTKSSGPSDSDGDKSSKPSKPSEPSRPSEPEKPSESSKPSKLREIGTVSYIPDFASGLGPEPEDVTSTESDIEPESEPVPEPEPVVMLTVSALTVSPSSVVAGNASVGTVTLSGSAPVGGQIVQLSSKDPGRPITFPATVVVKAGETAATFRIQTTPKMWATPTVKATLNDSSQIATLTIVPQPVLSAFTIVPASAISGSVSVGKVSLNNAASIDQVVSLSENTGGSLKLPATVTIKAGETSAAFNITAPAVYATVNATIKATFNGVQKTASFAINPPALSALMINPPTIESGESSTVTVTLNGPAPAAGRVVYLSVASRSPYSVPKSVMIAAGQTSGTFEVKSLVGTTVGSMNITATLQSSRKSVVLVILPQTIVSSLSVSPAWVTGGASAMGTVTLSRAAPVGGKEVLLSTDSGSAVTMPASVIVKAGATSATFSIATDASASTHATITAKLKTSVLTAKLFINPTMTVSSLTVAPGGVYGGDSAVGTVTLSTPAPVGGQVVQLATKGNASVPATVTVKADEISASFKIATGNNTMNASSNVTITAKIFDSQQSTTFVVNPVPTYCPYACQAKGCGSNEVAVPMTNYQYRCNVVSQPYSCGTWGRRTCWKTIVPTCCKPK